MLSALLFAATVVSAPPTYFAGKWRCTIAGLSGERIWISNNILDLGGRWLHMHIEGPSRVASKKYVGDVYIGYNDLSKKYARVTINNFGGYWISESDGWRGDSWVWTDVTTEDNEWGITEITRVSPDRYKSIEKTRMATDSKTVIRSRMDCQRIR